MVQSEVSDGLEKRSNRLIEILTKSEVNDGLREKIHWLMEMLPKSEVSDWNYNQKVSDGLGEESLTDWNTTKSEVSMGRWRESTGWLNLHHKWGGWIKGENQLIEMITKNYIKYKLINLKVRIRPILSCNATCMNFFLSYSYFKFV